LLARLPCVAGREVTAPNTVRVMRCLGESLTATYKPRQERNCHHLSGSRAGALSRAQFRSTQLDETLSPAAKIGALYAAYNISSLPDFTRAFP